MNTSLITIFFISFFVSYIVTKYIDFEWGEKATRKIWYSICITMILINLIRINIIGMLFFTILLMIGHYAHKKSDNLSVIKYKKAILALHELIDSGWGQVYKADICRTVAHENLKKLPKKKQQKLREWELSLEE